MISHKPKDEDATMPNDLTMKPNLLRQYFRHFAAKLADTPGSAHLGELAATSKAIPEPLRTALEAKLRQLDPRAVARQGYGPPLARVLPLPGPCAGSVRALAVGRPSMF